MARARFKVSSVQRTAYYHCLSRVVDRRFILGDVERSHFVALMRECEAFCEVRVLTYCVMSNHFHILVEVPQRPDAAELPSPEEVCAKLERLSGHQMVGAVRQRFENLTQHGDEAAKAAYLATFHARMWDVSAFMKMLKQRFTQWYNLRAGRLGTLWEERFRSVLVEGAGHALAAMSAYIDLNPVRARLVDDPKDYRWCGYAEAVAGKKPARLGLQTVVRALQQGREESIGKSLEIYRTWMVREGDERREARDVDGRTVRGAFSQEEVQRVLESKGALPLSEYVRCRVRYFCDGAVLGSREFAEGAFAEFRRHFGPRRRNGARRLKGIEDLSLFAVRDLQVDVFG
jgi:putative transposase